MLQSISKDVRVRLRRDPGELQVVDGVAQRLEWPASFVRVGDGLFAELVVDLPNHIESFDPAGFLGPIDQLLDLAWSQTITCTPHEVREVDIGLNRPMQTIGGDPPYVTAFALRAAEIFERERTPYAGALVAVPTPNYVLMFPFMTEAYEERELATERMSAIARANFDKFVQKKAVSPHVYFTRPGQGLKLEKA